MSLPDLLPGPNLERSSVVVLACRSSSQLSGRKPTGQDPFERLRVLRRATGSDGCRNVFQVENPTILTIARAPVVTATNRERPLFDALLPPSGAALRRPARPAAGAVCYCVFLFSLSDIKAGERSRRVEVAELTLGDGQEASL